MKNKEREGMKRLKTAFFYMRGLLGLKQIGMVCFAFLFSIFSTNLFAVTQGPNIPANAGSASCNNATLETYSGTSNLQANWEANPITLSWYSDDSRLTVQNSATTCTYDGILNVPSTPPTKTGYTFSGWKVRGLPSGYTRLEYIKSDGSSYINTGISPTANTRIEITVKVNSGAGNINIVGSGTGTSGSSSDALLVLNSYTNTKYEIKFAVSSAWNTSINYPTTEKNRLSLSATEFKINGIVYATSTASIPTSGTKPFYLFQRWRPSITSATSTIQIYGFEIFENNVPVQKLIPAKNSSNVVGMFDTVTQTFFTNAGSGSLVAGPVVQ